MPEQTRTRDNGRGDSTDDDYFDRRRARFSDEEERQIEVSAEARRRAAKKIREDIKAEEAESRGGKGKGTNKDLL